MGAAMGKNIKKNKTGGSFLLGAALAAFPFLLSSGAVGAAVSDRDEVVIDAEGLLSAKDMETSSGQGSSLSIVTVTSSQTMNSTSTGNTLTVSGSLTNGAISVGENFGGSGFGSYVMNTGNNAVINSGVSLSVLTLQP